MQWVELLSNFVQCMTPGCTLLPFYFIPLTCICVVFMHCGDILPANFSGDDIQCSHFDVVCTFRLAYRSAACVSDLSKSSACLFALGLRPFSQTAVNVSHLTHTSIIAH